MAENRERERAEFEAAIGKVIVTFNNLEKAVTDLLAVLTDPANTAKGEAIAWSIGFRQKLDVAVALFKLHDRTPELDARFRKAIKQASDRSEDRDRLTHAELWFMVPNGRHELRKGIVKGQRGFRPQHIDWTVEDIRQKADQIEELMDEIGSITTEMYHGTKQTTRQGGSTRKPEEQR